VYKTGLIVANCRVVVEVGKRMTELEKKAKAKTDQKKNTKSNNWSCDTRKAHADWVLSGRPVDEIGHPRLNMNHLTAGMPSLPCLVMLFVGWSARVVDPPSLLLLHGNPTVHVPPMQSIIGNNDGTYASHVIHLTAGMLSLPCLVMLFVGWSARIVGPPSLLLLQGNPTVQ